MALWTRTLRFLSRPSELARLSQPPGTTPGDLRAAGVPVGDMIAQEKDAEVLRRLIGRAAETGDGYWAIRAGRALLARDGSAEDRLRQAQRLFYAGHLDEAKSLLDALDPRAVDPGALADLDYRLRLSLGDTDVVSALDFDTLDPAAAMQKDLVTLNTLMNIGAFDALDRHLRGVGARGPARNIHLARGYALGRSVLEGWQAVIHEVETGHIDLPAPQRDEVRAELLLMGGRFYEAFDIFSRLLAADPLRWRLYGSAENAAGQSDRLDEYGALIDRAEDDLGQSHQTRVLRCNYLAASGDVATAVAMLDAIRARSEWQYLNARLGIACQSNWDVPAEKAYADCIAAGCPPGQHQMAYAHYLYFFKAANGGTTRAASVLEPVARVFGAEPGYHSLRLRLMIANDAGAKAAEVFSGLPAGMRSGVHLAPFAMFWRAESGDSASARRGWSRHLARSGHLCLNARSAYPAEVELKFNGTGDPVLCFLTVFNGIEFIDWFLDYYRDLGIGHFFVIDNGSDDGTFERLAAQPDVSLFSQPGSFAQSACGVHWVNHLMRRFGVGRWCLHVDMDEALVFPGQAAGRSLRDLIAYMEDRRFETLPGLMLDIYPEDLRADAASNPFARSRYIDTDYHFMPNEIPPYWFVQGGLRARMTGRSLMMTKAPLIRMRADTAYLANNHQHTHLRPSDISCALLHYKFVGDISGRIEEAITREEHFLGARFYKALQKDIVQQPTASGLLSRHSVIYRDDRQLEELGLIRTSASWQAFGG